MRRTFLHRVAACLSLALAVPACGDGSDGALDAGSLTGRDADRTRNDAGRQNEDDAGRPTPDAAIGDSRDAGHVVEPGTSSFGVDEVPGALATALCRALSACRGALLSELLGGEDCLTLSTNEREDSELRFLQASIDAKRVAFDPARMAKCTRDITALGCDALTTRGLPTCELALQGTVALDGDCDIDHECVGTAFCAKATPTTCPGKCTALRPEGAACATSRECDNGLACGRAAGATLGTCIRPPGEGESCQVLQCAIGFMCRRSDSRCHSLASIYTEARGAACRPVNQLCVEGSVCASTGGGLGVCEAPVANGAACHRADPNQCPREQYCNAPDASSPGTCVDFPADGDACLTERFQVCAKGHACVNGACKLKRRLDEPCVGNPQCYSGLCADLGSGPVCTTQSMCTL